MEKLKDLNVMCCSEKGAVSLLLECHRKIPHFVDNKRPGSIKNGKTSMAGSAKCCIYR